jgi:hypothetical protein
MRKSLKIAISVILTLVIAVASGNTISGVIGDLWFSVFADRITFDFPNENRPDWAGPKSGESLDLSQLISFGNSRASDLGRDSPILLTVIEKDCWATKLAKEQISFIESESRRIGLNHIVVSLNSKYNLDEIYTFSSGLGLNSDVYVWVPNSSEVNRSLVMMVVPSHVLVKGDGTVIKSFPGTSKDRRVRQHMAAEMFRIIRREYHP